MSERKDPLVGKKLGQFEIIEKIGQGGMASVYRARQVSINRIVAVKVLPPNLLNDPTFSERFAREVDVIAHLEHPHILPIYDYGDDEGVPYIAMRYLGGGSMADLIRRGVIPLDKIERPFRQVAQALDYAHREGVIHRDLKPANVMLDENGNAYLSDFGIARVLGSELTGSMLIGTPAYMSPEQANGLPIDSRSDVYSLGVVLFELVAGREPHRAENPMSLLLKHINEPTPDVRRYRADVPQAVSEVLYKATAKDPNDRYSSAGEFAAAFAEAIKQPVTPYTGSESLEDAATIAPGTPPPIRKATPIVNDYEQTTPLPRGAATAAQQGYQPTQAVGLGGQQTVAKKKTPVALYGVIGLVVVAVIAGVVLLPSLLNPGPAPQATPTVPPNFVSVGEAGIFALSVPRGWNAAAANDDGFRRAYVWLAADNSAFVSVSMVDAYNVSSSSGFLNGVDDYERRYYVPQSDQLVRLDGILGGETYPDGSIRRSYRMLDGGTFAAGQLDAFYMRRGQLLVVVETYTADSIGNEIIGDLNNVLSSLQVYVDSLGEDAG